ncbi:hypothetical protein LTR54_017734 [Friedmanniomyces endolithicus]|uniref:Uncharacterized protein n=1 Tax=Friedmanniomyces endolithicus TaxID=329885 RepID=A0AAN6F6D7_9PEZI|nr:hypothetical protein LTR82_017545 [Friedmanniomyces endolithicus]KAK0971671.1 hypothetical protein LTR54_017734 [Friedmanniomyces endolithicus]
MDILRLHGEQKELYEYSLNNALALAEGIISIVVVLQEPCNIADSVPWGPERVGSATLQEIDSLAEKSSNGRYGLDDLSISDLNTLLSQDLQDESDDIDADLDEAHSVFWNMILAKKPKAILVLTTSAGLSKHGPVTNLGSSLHRAGSTRLLTLWTKDGPHRSLIIYGFHPSVYLREDYVSSREWSSEEVRLANEVLHVCFAKAFEASCNLSRKSDHDDKIIRWQKLQRPGNSLDAQAALARLTLGL